MELYKAFMSVFYIIYISYLFQTFLRASDDVASYNAGFVASSILTVVVFKNVEFVAFDTLDAVVVYPVDFVASSFFLNSKIVALVKAIFLHDR